MTSEEATKHLTAKMLCIIRSKGFREKCDTYNSYEGCYECDLAYKQGNIGEQIESLKIAIQALKQEPKTGHWIDMGSGQECSECGEIQHGYDNFRFYCAKCGSKNVIESE